MKRIFVIAGLATAFLLLVVAASAQKANFAGTWMLDKAKSQGLSQRMMGADKVTLAITQDDKTITLDPPKIEGGQPPQGGGGGNGGGGGRGMGGPQSFTLDGKEASNTGQNGMTTAMKSSWDGAALVLTSVRSGNFNGQDFKTTSTQKLSLSDGGKTLTILTHREGGQQPQPDVTAVYTKQ